MTAFLDKTGRLKIILNSEELYEYKIIGIIIDHESPQNESALLNLLAIATLKTGFSPKSDNLSIEIYPSSDGGCVIYFIPEESEKIYTVKPLKNQKKQLTAAYYFDSSEEMILAIQRLYINDKLKSIKSDLYFYLDKYLMVFHPNENEKNDILILTEYGNKIADRTLLSKIVEHGTLLVLNNAVNRIGMAFESSKFKEISDTSQFLKYHLI